MPSKKRKYDTYPALMMSLKRSKVVSHGACATLLLDSFIENSGRILASQVVARGVCKEGEFKAWRKSMCEKGWLQWSANQPDLGQYHPGKKLIKYLNREKLENEEIATVREMRQADNEVKAELRAEMELQLDEYRELTIKLLKALEPPDDEQKREQRRLTHERMAELSKYKKPGTVIPKDLDDERSSDAPSEPQVKH